MRSDDLHQLELMAQGIPSMGGYGIRDLLRDAARDTPAGTAIVEVGCWLGAGTAQLALGLLSREDGEAPRIFCYDGWKATATEVKKAFDFTGVVLHEKQDTLPWVRKQLRPFNSEITFRKGDLMKAEWSDGPISLFIDDAAKRPHLFNKVLTTFGPSWIPGVTTLILMDCGYWNEIGNDEYRYQHDVIEAHPAHFTRLWTKARDVIQAFRYEAALDFDEFR